MKTTPHHIYCILITAAFLTLACPPSVQAQSGTWTNKTPMPFASQDPSGAVASNTFYAVCPAIAYAGEPSRLQAYDPASDSWTAKSPMLIDCDSFAEGVANNMIFLAGGWDGSSDHAELEAYNPTNDTWTLKTSMPSVLRAPAGGVVNGIFYVTGGAVTYPQPATLQHTVYAYHPDTDSWVTRAPMPTARASHGVGVVNGILYAVGGATPAGALSTVEAYDPVADAWTTKAPMPTARYALSITVLNGLLYAVGGVDTAGNYLPTVEVYNPATDAWATLAPMPTPRQHPALGALGGYVFAAGGFNLASGSLRVLEVLSPPTILGINMYAGLTVIGPVGSTNRIDYKNSFNNPNWTVLTNIVLSASPYLFIDTTSAFSSQRFYRAVPLP
ncbi:MAG: hypothetical protein C5B50_02410 [Verrucomicrobia bacterium]|nr:MAG: hypothetical protein C5B50_02410 [Verrucomicrobiota bacterium]